jgi:hypothetical protein
MCRPSKDRQPWTRQGAKWAPQTARRLANCTTRMSAATKVRVGRLLVGLGLCAREISLNHDRLPVLCRPSESGERLGCPLAEPQAHIAVIAGLTAQFRLRRKGLENDQPGN